MDHVEPFFFALFFRVHAPFSRNTINRNTPPSQSRLNTTRWRVRVRIGYNSVNGGGCGERGIQDRAAELLSTQSYPGGYL